MKRGVDGEVEGRLPGADEMADKDGQGVSKDATAHCKQQAFRHQLTHQLPSAGAESQAYSDLMTPVGGTSQQHARQVDAGKQEYQPGKCRENGNDAGHGTAQIISE